MGYFPGAERVSLEHVLRERQQTGRLMSDPM
jgi:hypothetical protein